jgi:hypothetical protein
MIDLHLHTIFSDGTDTPLELIEKIKKHGIHTFSITDHDDIRANEIISTEYVKECSGLRFITGVEISAIFKGINIYLLCYNFDIYDLNVKNMIATVAAMNKPRTIATLKHLSDYHNISLSIGAASELLSNAISGKQHIIYAVKNEYRHLCTEDIKSYINEMDVCKYRIDAKYVIETIKNAGGFVAVAHPIEIQQEYQFEVLQLKVFLQKLKEIGLSAIEVYNSAHSLDNIADYKRISDDLELNKVGGSDFLGYNQQVKIGQLSSCEFVPDISEIYLP